MGPDLHLGPHHPQRHLLDTQLRNTMTSEENLELHNIKTDYEDLKIAFSKLLTDYNYMKNSTDVLDKNEMRFKIELDGIPTDAQHEMAATIADVIMAHQAKYVFEVEDEGAIYKTTAAPND
jgi:hypothetical protein